MERQGSVKRLPFLFAEQGADVAIFGTNPERAELALKEIEAARISDTQKVQALLVDVSKSKDVEEAIQKLLGSFGKVDILINNAGTTKDNLLMRMSEEDWDLVMDVNLKSVYNTCKSLTRSMMKARSGSILILLL